MVSGTSYQTRTLSTTVKMSAPQNRSLRPSLKVHSIKAAKITSPVWLSDSTLLLAQSTDM